MPDTPEKRRREAQKRKNREIKADRKRMRREGIIGQDNSGLFAPGELQRETVGGIEVVKPPPPPPVIDPQSPPAKTN